LTIRIIGGEFKGRKLATVRGIKTRPTADRVRESIFNILGDSVRGARVLDLYAGTGAMGIEALSRGAESVLFADDHRAALAALKKNIKTCSLQSRTNMIKWNILNNLNVIRLHRPAFNLVFLDPPYNKNMIQPTLSNLGISRCLEHGSRITLEHSPREPIPENLPGFKIFDQRRYGKTLVSFLIFMV
jgi:16S rRNA (guanine966-N2)-methyltransferase